MNWPTVVCPDQLGGSPDHPVLLGNRCSDCGEPFFPAARGCTRCTGGTLEPVELGDAGTLWSWTVQMFEPKTPYDAAPAPGTFKPYGVGYVELANGLKIETRLLGDASAGFTIGQPMRLVLEPYRKNATGEDVYTYAFEAAP